MSRRSVPRLGRRDKPPYPTAAEWENWVNKVLCPYAQLLWEEGALDHARALPSLAGERARLEALRCADPAAYRYHYRRLYLALTNQGALIIPCTDGSVRIQHAPELDAIARAGYDAVVLSVLHSAGLLHEAAPYEVLWLQSLVAHLLLASERLDSEEKLLRLPEPRPLPYHGERSAGALPRIVREPGYRKEERAIADRLERALQDPFAPRVPLPRPPTKKRLRKDKRRRDVGALAARLRAQGLSVLQIRWNTEFRALVKKAGLKGTDPECPDVLAESTIRRLIQDERARQV